MVASEAVPRRACPVSRDVALPLAIACGLALLGWILFALTYRHTHDVSARGMFPDGPLYLDLFNYVTQWEVFRTPAFFEVAPPWVHRSHFAYPPAAAMCYAVLYRSHRMNLLYNVLTFGFWLTLLGGFGAALWWRSASWKTVLFCPLALVLLSYPAVFLYERANIEIFLWIVLVAGALLYRSGSFQRAAICFGIAAAIKLYPFFLLGLFVHRRREWSALVTSAFTALVVTVLSIRYTAPGFFWYGARGYAEGVMGFQAKYAGTVQAGGVAYDHSLFSWLKLPALASGHPAAPLMRPYYLICGLLALVVFFGWVRKRPFLNRLSFLVVLTVVLPPVSFEYTLVHLYLPVMLLLVALLQRGQPSAASRNTALVALGCFLALLLPIDLLGPAAARAGQYQVAFLLALLGMSAWQPWTSVPEDTAQPQMQAQPALA